MANSSMPRHPSWLYSQTKRPPHDSVDANFSLWQETSKKLLESWDMSVYISKNNRCPWPYPIELRPSWQAGLVLTDPDPSCHCQWAGAALAGGPGTISLSWGSTPVLSKQTHAPETWHSPQLSHVTQLPHWEPYLSCKSWGVCVGCFLLWLCSGSKRNKICASRIRPLA